MTFVDQEHENLNVAPFALIYIFNISDIKPVLGPITINWRSEKGPGTGIFCDSVFTIAYDPVTNAYRFAAISHKIYHGSTSNPQLDSSFATLVKIFDAGDVVGNSITIALFTNTLIEEAPSLFNPGNYKMKTLMHFAVFPRCLEHFSGSIPDGPLISDNQMNFIDRLTYNIPSSDKVLLSKSGFALSFDWHSGASKLDIRVKAVTSIEWLPDYAAISIL